MEVEEGVGECEEEEHVEHAEVCAEGVEEEHAVEAYI